MWRSLFLALGISAVVIGAECLAIDKAILKTPAAAEPPPTASIFGGSVKPAGREVVPPDWAPWSLLSGGAVTILYSFTVPKRVGSK